jgi:Flagellar hook-length control protein FliK
VDLIVSTPTVALNPQQGAATPAFKPGDVIEAQVVQLIGNNAAKLAVGKLIMDVQTLVPLMVGATVRLAVKSTPNGIRLTLLGNGTSAPGGNPASAPASPTAGAPTAEGSVLAAVAPAAANAAAATLATGGADNGAASSAAAPLAAATAGSGATSDAPATAAALPDPPLAPVPPSNPVAVATVALAAAVQSSAARQNGLAPLLADAEVATNLVGLPEPVRQATERLLALQPALDETTSADSIRQALDRSGLFLEAHLSAAAGGDPTQARASVRPGGVPMPADDLKAALIVLRNILKTWVGADAPGVSLPSTPTAGPLKPAAAPLDLGGPPAAADSGGKAGEMASGAPAAPPPPYRGAPTSAQPPAPPSISPDMSPRDIGKVLLNETDAALARQTLLQAASLPSHAGAPGPVQHGPSGPQWHFEVPFATPQGSTIAQFEIARDGHHAAAEGIKTAWRARFSLDLDPIGPVHAQIAVTGTRAAVTLWAERPDTSAQLRDSASQLAEALRRAELEPGDVLVRAGTPPRPREGAPAGRFLDRAS